MLTQTERQREWRKNNPEKFEAQKKRWRANRKGKDRSHQWLHLEGESFYDWLRKRWSQIRSDKKAKGREFNIIPDDLELPELCPILNIPIDYSGKDPNCKWTMDCLVPSKGYTKGNVHIISNRANRIKNDGTIEEHLLIAKWMKSKT